MITATALKMVGLIERRMLCECLIWLRAVMRVRKCIPRLFCYISRADDFFALSSSHHNLSELVGANEEMFHGGTSVSHVLEYPAYRHGLATCV